MNTHLKPFPGMSAYLSLTISKYCSLQLSYLPHLLAPAVEIFISHGKHVRLADVVSTITIGMHEKFMQGIVNSQGNRFLSGCSSTAQVFVASLVTR